MHTHRTQIATALCGLTLVSGCAFFRPSPLQLATAPFSIARDSASSSKPDYQPGRAMLGQSDYLKAIEKNPADAEAHNGLGVLYAMQGKNEQAVNELMEAAAIAPKAAYIQNNLGFAYLLSGRNADALTVLNIASALDPANERIRENLRKAEARVARATGASETPTQATAADVPRTATQVDIAADPNAPTLVSVAPNIFELRQNQRRSLSVVPSIATAVAAPALKIEIVNGNGVAGLAKRTSSLLQQRGYAIARLTNQTPYTQGTTQIQYRRGQEMVVQQLTGLISTSAVAVESHQLSAEIGVRLVLGRDAMQGSLLTQQVSPNKAIARRDVAAGGQS
jgi:tetratricopeptide (TPR) repeat protein